MSTIDALPKRLVAVLIVVAFGHADLAWENRVQLDENYLLLWTVRAPDIVLEMQVRTHGYVGFGLSRDGTIYGSDIFISWIDDGHMFFYDCHIKTHTQTHEPVVDTSQDYELLAGSENSTHTILRFRRKLNTCDDKSDVPITNDTMSIIFLYHDEKPRRNTFRERLPSLMLSLHQIRPLLLLQRSPTLSTSFSPLEIRMPNVTIESPALLKLCHTLASNFTRIVRYEPLFSSNHSSAFVTLMRVFECHGVTGDTPATDHCSERLKMSHKCLATVAIWTRGSSGFTFPSEVALTLDSRHVMLEIHYQHAPASFTDTSGFRLFTITHARTHEAGTITVNIRPNFLHIIAPGFKRVVSLAHCTANCTRESLPAAGVTVFGVAMQTHSAGTMIKLAAVRNGEELEPLASDSHLSGDYAETRLLTNYRRLMPGDHLMVECTYNTFKRERFTLGGESAVEEVCMAVVMYYPRQRALAACSSQSKISDVLRSLGIEELGKTSNQTVISKPERYAGRTLERHLELYDWRNEFFTFERIIKTSAFEGYCSGADTPTRITGDPPLISRPFRPADSLCEDDASENAIDDDKEVRSPSTLQQHTSHGNARATSSALLVIVLAALQLGCRQM